MSKKIILVDLDGTLAVYDGWKGPDHIGDPVPAMRDRVKAWLAEGAEVVVFTARMDYAHSLESRELFARAFSIWCRVHFGTVLLATSVKDHRAEEFWDDRAVAVEKNTGRRLSPSRVEPD